MKLLRFGPLGSEKPGILDENGDIRDLSGIIDDVSCEALSDGSLVLALQVLENSYASG